MNAGAGPAIGEEERERWRRDLGVAREEANELREELLHRREEARALKVWGMGKEGAVVLGPEAWGD